ncbi:hypothetical protein [Cognaticolwellia beringensis]|uniref:Uncharacterized protein n=1 Tax=Cognaticolwellia beringensis TaxID=1967665 RepID=A0A222GB86_9GAMM|nr:hypothetical protein [Cognaticolwellia beringensis]ASP49149.1 hypothetical protein B5D82_16085 [Cognaticolwellia beringensis]
MQVNNTANLASQAALALGNSNSVPAQEQRTRALARETLSNEENQSQKSQADIDSRQRLDIDDQAIALIEREQLPQFESRNNAQRSNHQGAQSNSYNSGYDSPSNQNQSAVAAYQSIGAIAQRDNIQQIFGVDLFA